MKYYLLYFNGQFFAYADNKEIINKFLKIRNEHFEVLAIKEKDIPKNLLEYQYDGNQLIYYNGYHSVNECPLREFELDMFEEEIRNASLQAKSDMLDIIEKLKYIRFNETERKIIKTAFFRIFNLLEDITESDHEVIYDEVIDILKFMKYVHQM